MCVGREAGTQRPTDKVRAGGGGDGDAQETRSTRRRRRRTAEQSRRGSRRQGFEVGAKDGVGEKEEEGGRIRVSACPEWGLLGGCCFCRSCVARRGMQPQALFFCLQVMLSNRQEVTTGCGWGWLQRRQCGVGQPVCVSTTTDAGTSSSGGGGGGSSARGRMVVLVYFAVHGGDGDGDDRRRRGSGL